MNRLAKTTSPYLLQHKDNPVEWWPWGPEALAAARGSGKPILLSVGYAACHWCHVMAHESFEDPGTAAVMNALFVNIKVDREERPDVDHIYMSALHALGERGGWPLTMFLTPDGVPFWGGTYFPKEARFGHASFTTILNEVARVFRDEPERIAHNRDALLDALAETETRAAGGGLGRAELDTVGAQLPRAFDPVNGGLGGAPKFPNPAILELLWRHADRSGDGEARQLFRLSLERMARGGIHDHLGGGFARYSVDQRWLAPHFEKMLYDNAQLLELFALEARQSGDTLCREAAEGIVLWLAREMVTPEGAFAASLDADSEGEEGRFYVWSEAEVGEVLGEEALIFASHYDVSAEGNWEGHAILNRLDTPDPDTASAARLGAMRERLLARRATRVRPGLDDKVLADWNGLMIAALVRAALLLGRDDWLVPAERAFGFIAREMVRVGRLGHSWRSGELLYPGFASDHAAMARAALVLHEATGKSTYREAAEGWLAVLAEDYAEPATGILAMTAVTSGELIVRPRPVHDDAVPNANGLYAEALVRRAMLSGTAEDRKRADRVLEQLTAAARQSPVGHASILNALDLHLRGATIITIGPRDRELREAALSSPYTLRAITSVGSVDELEPDHLAAAHGGVGSVALVCAAQRCSLPLTEPRQLVDRIEEMTRG